MAEHRVRVMAERCSSCVFRPNNPMHLATGRLAALIEHNRHVGAALVCHHTTHRQQPQEALCRGYLDAYGDTTASVQVYRRMGGVIDTVTEDGVVVGQLDDNR